MFSETQAVGSGLIQIEGFNSIGGSGTACWPVATVASRLLVGPRFAVPAADRNARPQRLTATFAEESATLSLSHTSVRHVGAFADSTLNVGLTSALSVTVDRGTVNLEGASIADRIDVFGKGRLLFGGGSTVEGSITNLGDPTGLVRIDSGSVGGDLVGLGSSITAMSGGSCELARFERSSNLPIRAAPSALPTLHRPTRLMLLPYFAATRARVAMTCFQRRRASPP
jgi:hypothetical protein